MKKINLIEWLSRNSHEKQSPQRFARYAAMLIMLLTLGAGQMWGYTIIRNGELNGGGDWSNSDAMTRIGSTNVYYKTYNSPTATTDLFFRIGTGDGWGTKKDNSGIDNLNSNIVMLATSEHDNCVRFQVPVSVPVTIYYNDNTDKIWIKVDSYKTDVLNGKEMFYYGFTNSWSETFAHFYDNGTRKFGNYAANSYADHSAKLAIGVYDVNGSTNYSASNSDSWAGETHTGMAAGCQIQTYNDGSNKCYYNAASTFSFDTTAFTIVTGQTIASFPTISFTSKTSGVGSSLSLEGYYYSTATNGETWTAFTPGTTESSLAAGTYYIKAIATDGAIYMASTNYITLTVNSAPVLGVANATSVTSNSATFNATATLNSNTTSSYGFKYGAGASYDTKAELISGGTSASTTGALDGTTFSKEVTGLSASTTYYYISYAVVNGTTYYSDAVKSFTTSAAATYNLSVVAGTGISAVTGSTNNISANQSIAITATVATGYTWSTWTKTGAGTLSTFTAGTKDQTVKVGAVGNMTLTASATENMSTLTTSNSYNAGDPRYAIPTKSASSIGISTTATLTATTPSTGYTFAGWTLSDNLVVTSGDKDNDLSIIVRTNGNGAEATAQANYEEVLTSTYYLVGNNTSVFPGDATWTASDSKNMLRKASGSSTGSVGSITINVKSIPANSSDYQFKIHESSANKWWGWSNENYYWMDATKTTSLYDNQHNLYFIPNALGDYTFTTDWSNEDEPSLTVTFPATTYTVNFGYREGGSSVTATYGGTSFASGTKVQSGKSVTFTYTKASGYNFAGWYNASTGGSKVSSDDSYTTTISGATTIYAAFTPITYNSGVLKKNGGSEDGSYTVTYNATSITPSAPTKTGYHVDGYYAEAGTSTHIATAAGVLQNNKSGYTDATGHWNYAGVKDLYAKWAANTYTAENNIDGDGGSNGKYTATYDATSIVINTAPTRTGYNLTGFHAYGCIANSLANSSGTLTASQSEARDKDAKTLTDASKHWIYDGTDAVIYADWSPKTYSISLDQEGGASGSTSVTMTYDASTHTAITNPSKTGYTFAGYWTGDDGTGSMVIATDGTMQANVSTYTGDGGIWKKDATCTLYAKWTPNNYAVTLSTTSETGYGSGAPDNQTATYGAAMPTITPPVGAAGYKFQGYFTAVNGAGTQYYNANGTSAHEWDIASASTLHAYFQKAEITALEHASSVAKGETTYLVVNPTMNLVPEGYSAICWTLHYAENDNPVSEESWSVDRYTEGGTKQNQVRFTFTNLAVGSYYVKAVLKANASSFDPCSVGTELDTETGDFSVIGSSTITVRYQYLATGDMIASSGSVEIDAGGNADITAPNILGYSFNSWSVGAGVTKNSEDGNTINVSSTYDGVVTAFYTKKNMIYFNNANVDWDTVYVYFYSSNKYWDNAKGTGAYYDKEISSAKAHWYHMWGGMTRIGSSNVYYLDYEDSIANASWNSEIRSYTNVAFTDKPQGYGYGSDKEGYEFFYDDVKVVRREDFSHSKSMFVPLAEPTTMKNSEKATYYDQGYWMNYPESTGYTLNIYDNTTDGGLRKSIQFPFAADMKMPMAITTDLEGGKTYGFQLYRIDGTTYGNSGTMTNGHSGDEGQGVWEFKSDVTNKAGLTTTSAGDYTFTLTYGMDLSSNYNYLIGVRYPESTGDFRVQYKDNENSTWKTSVVIPKLTEADTVSYFVRISQSPYIRVQKCTATYGEGTGTTITWDNVNGGADILPDTISANGVYNFIFTKDGDNLVLSEVEPYTGNFYIRVDGAGSTNWDNYRAADHIMPFSEYSFSQEENAYSHYFTKWYDTSGGAKNIKFVVANDYSTNISDTIVKDGIADNYVDVNGWLSGRSANVRFMYNYKTNEASRRYIDGAQGPGSDDFLKIICEYENQISIRNYDDTADSLVSEVKFTDNGNWIYEANVKAKPGSKYKLRSSFGVSPNVVYQYFKGAASGEGEYEELIGGDPSGSSLQIRLLYDFKTNRLVAAYVPSGMIDDNLVINADIMFVREHQGNVTQITFGEDKSISAIENVYSTLRFNKSTINDPSLSRYERDLFYVSFPYDVQLSDVIGFGDYGKHWIIEYYDGAGRAEKGFWADSESFWKFVTPAMKNSFKLKAGTGYIVALDLDEMGNSSSIWDNTSTVELIFPGDISAICDQEVTYTMPQHQCNIGPRFEGGDDRRIKDSHWNVLGVPTYHNTTGTFENHTDEIGGKSQVWSTDGKPNFLYTWNMTDNSLSVTSASGYNYKAMHAYIVQYYGDVTFHTSTNAAPSPIVARRTYAEKPIDVDFRLELSKNGVVEDQTFVSMTNDEEASVNFVFGEDLSKEFNKNKANIYTMVTTQMADGPSITEAAGNTLPMTNQTTIVPVGVKIAADGEYTFSIPEGTYGVGITLIDNEAGARVNLGLMDYTVTLAAGQIDDRFVLEISPVHQSPTGVELLNGENGENGVRKVLIDNILYIVKDGKVFDAQGKRLQ